MNQYAKYFLPIEGVVLKGRMSHIHHFEKTGFEDFGQKYPSISP